MGVLVEADGDGQGEPLNGGRGSWGCGGGSARFERVDVSCADMPGGK